MIVPYITQIWYHFYQFMTRFILPVLFFMLVLNWKYLAVDSDLETKATLKGSETIFRPEVECDFTSDQFTSFKNLYRCLMKTVGIENEQEKSLVVYNTVSSSIKGLPDTISPSLLQKTILKYGFLKRSFMVELSELLLWYGNLTIYALTVVYIVFLRKTVYEI